MTKDERIDQLSVLEICELCDVTISDENFNVCGTCYNKAITAKRDAAKKDGMFRAITILKSIGLSNEHGEREAWPAIREAIKAIEAEI